MHKPTAGGCAASLLRAFCAVPAAAMAEPFIRTTRAIRAAAAAVASAARFIHAPGTGTSNELANHLEPPASDDSRGEQARSGRPRK
jgi:hypothetical protein